MKLTSRNGKVKQGFQPLRRRQWNLLLTTIGQSANLDILSKSLKKSRIGLVLGSGGARGWAHVGVCLELYRRGLRPHCIVGSSIGSIVGALAAAGRLPSLVELAHHLDWQRTARLFVEVGLPRSGLLNGRRIKRFLREIIGVGRMEDLPVPLAAVATDLYSEQSVILDRGDTVSALRASISIPGLLKPVVYGDKWLVDGGLVNPLPVDVARAMGAETVIASEVNLKRGASEVETPTPGTDRSGGEQALSDGIRRVLRFVRNRSERFGAQAEDVIAALAEEREAPGIFDVLLRSTRIGENRITRGQIERHPPEYLVQPAVGHLGTLDFHRGAEAIAAGRIAAGALASVNVKGI